MIYGRYWSKQRIYKLGGKHLVPKWFIPFGADPLDAQNMAIEANDSKPNPGWPKAIFVLNESRWNVVKEHYGDIYALTQLHCFHMGQAGNLPAWANPWVSSAYALIHEYALEEAPGKGSKVAWLRPDELFDNDIYMFFRDATAEEIKSLEVVTPPPPPPPDDEDPVEPDGNIPLWVWLVIGGLGVLAAFLLGLVI
jgi:hypothetical protein